MSQLASSPPPQQKNNLSRRSVKAMAGVLVSRFSGIFRTLVVNAVFGANVVLDAFNAAFRFPNSLRDLFADGALSAAFVKTFIDVKAQQGTDQAQAFLSVVLGFFLTVTLLIAALGALFALPFLTLVSDETFDRGGGLQLAAGLFQILVFYLPLTMLNAITMALLNIRGQTFRAMNGSLWVNAGFIGGALLFAPLFSLLGWSIVYGLAWGALLGACCQLLYQSWPLVKDRQFPWPTFHVGTWWRSQPLKETIVLMLPRTIGQGALTLALLVNTFFALSIGPGTLTYVTTTVTIIQVPIGLFGVATGFAAQPLLVRALQTSPGREFLNLLKENLHTSMTLALMALGAFALLVVPFYRFVFEHGRITYNDTLQNSLAICAYGIGIVFGAGSKVITNAFYALGSTWAVAFTAAFYLFVNASLSAWLTPSFGLVGLGLSYSTATAFDFLLNTIILKKIYGQYWQRHHDETGVPQLWSRANLWHGVIASLGAYALGFLGITLVQHFWSTSPPLGWWQAGSTLLLVGAAYVGMIFVISRRFFYKLRFF